MASRKGLSTRTHGHHLPGWSHTRTNFSQIPTDLAFSSGAGESRESDRTVSIMPRRWTTSSSIPRASYNQTGSKFGLFLDNLPTKQVTATKLVRSSPVSFCLRAVKKGTA